MNTSKKKYTHVYHFEEKPIATKVRGLMCLSQEIVSKITKNYKYQIGTDILTTTSRLGYCVYDALDQMGFGKEKNDKIENILKCLRSCILVLRVAKDLNLISTDKFEQYVNAAVSLKTQTENWKHFVEEKAKTEATNDKQE